MLVKKYFFTKRDSSAIFLYKLTPVRRKEILLLTKGSAMPFFFLRELISNQKSA